MITKEEYNNALKIVTDYQKEKILNNLPDGSKFTRLDYFINLIPEKKGDNSRTRLIIGLNRLLEESKSHNNIFIGDLDDYKIFSKYKGLGYKAYLSWCDVRNIKPIITKKQRNEYSYHKEIRIRAFARPDQLRYNQNNNSTAI